MTLLFLLRGQRTHTGRLTVDMTTTLVLFFFDLPKMGHVRKGRFDRFLMVADHLEFPRQAVIEFFVR